MPQYYGRDPLNDVVAGAMAGFEMFQRMKQRKADEEQRAIDNRRQDEADRMRREQFEMSKTAFNNEQTDRTRRNAREDVENAREDESYRFTLGERERAVRERDEKDQLTYDVLALENRAEIPRPAMFARGDSPKGGPGIDSAIAASAQKYGIPPAALRELAISESSLDPAAYNGQDGSGGSFGLFQINGQHLQPGGAFEGMTPEQIMDVSTNADAGGAIFADALKRAGGDVRKAVFLYKGAVSPEAQARLAPVADRIAAAFQQGGSSAPAPATAPAPASGSLKGVTAKPASYTDPVTSAVQAVVAAPGKVAKAFDDRNVRNILRTALDTSDARGNDVRTYPQQYVSAYLQTREGFSKPEQDKLDRLMFEGLKTAADSAREIIENTNNPKAKADAIKRVDEVRGQVNALASARGNSAIAAVVSNGNRVKPGPAPAAAVEQAVAATQGNTMDTSAAEIRGLTTQMGRLADNPPPRFNETQLRKISRAVSLGVISMEQARNLVQYGKMDKPASSELKFTNLGNGLVIAQRGDNAVMLNYSKEVAAAEGAKNAAKDGGALSASEMRLRQENNVKRAEGWFAGFDGGDDLGNRQPLAHVAALSELLTRFGPEIEQRKGYRLYDPTTGGYGLANLPIGELNTLLEAYKEWNSLEVNEWNKNGRTFMDYVNDRVPDMPRPMPTRGQVVNGYEYIGDGTDVSESSWRKVE